MENRIDILNELKELSSAIAAIKKVNVFSVPDGYFDFLSGDIMMGIAAERGVDIHASATNAADIPTGYFNTLADAVLQKIKVLENEDAATEIRTLSPMLYSIQNENVFEVPEGYFEYLPATILDKVKPQAKVVAMKRRSNNFFKYAVAAALTGVMALSVVKFTGNSSKKVVLPGYVTAGMQIENVDQELSKISDTEIVKYLVASGTDIKAAYVANSIDNNELPSQEDYLLDDQALDKYLNSINLDDLKN